MWRRASIVAILLLLTSVFVVAQPALAQNPVWSAQYYNNGTLNGTPAFTRNDNNIAFNWGTGSPGEGINADNFSVRWATDVALSAGTYRFYAQADDNIRIIFNFGFSPVIDTFGQGQAGQLVTGDVQVPAGGTYHIQVDYSEATDQAYAFVSFANLATDPTGPGFQPPVNIPVPSGAWTAQYYSNNNLAGDPSAILSEGSPSHDWGTGSPLPSMPADNWSARWISTQNLAGGVYNLSVRADDGVRVYINGNLTINEWHGASGQTYAVSLNLPGGLNYFQVEFYDATANAFLDYQFTQTGGGSPTQVPSPTGATATVTAYRLNVRNQPDAVNGQVITRINRLEVYPIVGRTSDNRWYLISLTSGAQGWVSGGYINVANGANIPVADGSGQPQPTSVPPQGAEGNEVIAQQYNVVIRSGPGTQFNRIGLFPVGGVAPVVGRNTNNTWWQINLNGVVGWVSAQYAIISQTANVGGIPITG